MAVRKGVMNEMLREAIRSDPYSQLRIGWLYDLGWGVEQSAYKAIAWYTGAKVMGLKTADRLLDSLGQRMGVSPDTELNTDG